MKFLVDWPLGGLAKWLRFCGFDATLVRLDWHKPGTWPPPKPRTCILTRREAGRRLKRPDLVVLDAVFPEGQMAEVMQRLGLTARHLKPLSRCSHCNEPLISLDRDLVRGRVPEYIFHSQPRFYECPKCRRVYWPGSHIKGISGTLRERLENLSAEGKKLSMEPPLDKERT